MTLNDFYKNNLKQTGIIPNIPAFGSYESLADYFLNQTAYDSAILLKEGNLLMASDDSEIIINTINAVVHQLAPYKWQKLYESMNLKYNPIWNVDGTETTVYGEHITTDLNGERKSTVVNGQKHTNSEYYTVPYDSTTDHKTGSDQTTTDSVTDTTTAEAVTDTNTSGAHTDTVTRQGNIGVTSTQNLIKQEREIVNFNLYHTILMDVVDAITIPIYEEEVGGCELWW